MKLAVYEQIVEECRKSNTRNPNFLNERFKEIPRNTLGSIISQEYQKKMKRFHHRHHTAEATNHYYETYLSYTKTSCKKGYLMELADNMDISPSLMARIVLEKHYIKDGETVNKTEINRMMKNTSLINDKDLAVEIFLCILDDEIYGPIADATKHCIGIEYENKLKNELRRLGIIFFDENCLREKGYDKTPDVKLEIPIAVDGHVINWIESKASFGDKESHKSYLKEQFWSYWNRFGPGLVIYWFGFIEELDVNKDKGIMLKDHMPTNITFMKPLSLLKT